MNLVVFAYGAGLLATVNPCGFAMLPAFLGFYIGGADTESGTLSPYNRAVQGVRVGAAVSAGFGAVFTIVGLAVTAGLRQLVSVVPWVAVVLGVAFAIMGAAMIGGRHIGVAAAQRVQVDTQQRSYPRMVAFGAAHAFASLSCTLAVLLSVIAQALATDNPAQLVAVFAAYAAGAATLLMALALSAAFARQGLAAKLQRVLPVATRLGGAVLTLSGLYLIAYWLPSLLGSDARNPLTAPVEAVSSTISTWLSDNTGLAALVGAALAVGVATTATARLLRRRDHHDTPEPRDEQFAVDCCTPSLSTTAPTTRPEDPDMTDYRAQPVPPALGARLAELYALHDTPVTLGQLADQLAGLLTQLASTDTVESLLCCADTSRHQTHIDGQVIHTHCVLDALMIPAIRNRPATIHSTSPQDDQPIHLTVDHDTFTADPPTAVMSLGVARNGTGSIYDLACPYINAFTSDDAYRRWVDATPDAFTMSLSIGDAVTLAADLVVQTRAASHV